MASRISFKEDVLFNLVCSPVAEFSSLLSPSKLKHSGRERFSTAGEMRPRSRILVFALLSKKKQHEKNIEYHKFP